MALVVSLRTIEGLEGKGDRKIRGYFRGFPRDSKIVHAKDSTYIGDNLQWMVARKLEYHDTMELRVYNVSRLGKDKFIGSMKMSLHTLNDEGNVSIRENLVDSRNCLLTVMISFDVTLQSPHVDIDTFRMDDFEYPGIELPKKKRKKGSTGESQYQDSVLGDLDNDKGVVGGFDDFSDEGSDNSRDDVSSLSMSPKRQLHVPALLDPTLFKEEDFQVTVAIIEARQLSGANINPLIEIRCGMGIRRTRVEFSTNSPYYNDFYCFDYHVSMQELMDKVVIIRALAMGTNVISRILPGKLIGEFRIDLRTVWNAPEHAFQHKWAVLLHPKDVLAGPKGYVKCSIGVICRGDPIKPKAVKSSPTGEEDIEANLLIPDVLAKRERQMATIAVKIYRAEDLPKMNTDLVANIKEMILGESRPLADPFVQVSFSGHTAKTKKKSNTYNPEWNQEIVFTDMFPPLCNRIRVSVMDWDALYNEVIATHYIELRQISNSQEEGFLPTFGPSWVNLYGTPRDYGYGDMVHRRDALNQGLGEGAAFRGRLLMAVKTTIKQDSSGLVAGARTGPTPPVSELVAGKREDFLLMAVLYEASAINKEYGEKKKPLQFEISIGTYGNSLDGRRYLHQKDEPVKSKAKDKDGNPIPVRSKQQTVWMHSITDPMIPVTTHNDYYHMPFWNTKPMLYTRCKFEDQRPRMHIPNIIDHLREEFQKSLYEVEIMHERNKRGAHRRMRTILDRLHENLESAADSVRSCRGTGSRTFLDKERQKVYRVQFEKLKTKCKVMKQECSKFTLAEKIKEARAMVNIMIDLADDPQHGLPDVFVWMIQENKRIAFARIAARRIANSVVESEMGKDCGEVLTLFLRKPGRKGLGSEGWTIEAKLNIFFWLGLFRDAKAFKDLIPAGYDSTVFRGITQLPFEINYTEQSTYEFRTYLFMARNLIGSDDSGLSDAFVRVLLNDHVLTTFVINQTLSPCWDCTLVVEEMHFNFSHESIAATPPVVVVEVFDEDILLGRQSIEFIGRSFCRPVVNNVGEEYQLPKLEWWDIFRGQTRAGELLASFELKQLVQDTGIQEEEEEDDYESMTSDGAHSEESMASIEGITDENRPADMQRVPRGVRPLLSAFRLEILFWGMRNLKRLLILSVKSPKVYIEFGGYHIESDMIPNFDDRQNFTNSVKHVDLYLPENKSFWPPLQIQCRDCRHFGRELLIGTHLISDIAKYYKMSEEEIVAMEATSDAASQVESEPAGLGLMGTFAKTTSLSSFPLKSRSRAGSVMGVSTKGGKTNGTVAGGHGNATLPGTNVATTEVAEGDEDDEKAQEEVPGGPGEPIQIPQRPKVPKEELNDLDWWSRYYASWKDMYRLEEEEPELVDKVSVIGDEVLDDIEVTLKEEKDDNDSIVDIPEEAPKKRKRKRKKKRKKRRRIPFIQGDPSKAYNEEEDDLIYERDIQEDDSWIERVKLYRHAVEELKEFNTLPRFYKNFALTRGKQADDDEPIETRTVGLFKGNILLYRIDPIEVGENPETDLTLMENLPSNDMKNMAVRVYIVRGIDLRPTDITGKTDPYLRVTLGSKKYNDRENYIPNQLNPFFGKVFEFDARFPQESLLTVTLMDYDTVGRDDLIGETKIDLEDRYFSKHRQTCGLALNYDNHGYNRWRDVLPPTRILNGLCKDHEFEAPKYEPLFNRVTVNDMEFFALTEIEDDGGDIKQSNEPLALEVLKNWKKLSGYSLLPEHVETRSLYLPSAPGLEQGRLEMWVDILPRELGFPPAATDITPREAKGYELRIIIWDTMEVILADDSILTGEKSSDIFVKGWIKGSTVDAQQTDVHYRSLTGEGNFNWRLIFKFDYIKAEDMVIFRQKETKVNIEETEFKVPCNITLQVFDADLVGSDDFLGGIMFRLSQMPRGAKSYKSCGLHQTTKDGSVPTVSIFRNKRCRGWWPFTAESEDDPNIMEVTGKVDAEFELVSAEEAEQNPVGSGRAEPQPLPPPQRPETSFLSFLNPLKALKYLICVRLKWFLIKLLIITAFAALLVLFIYAAPGYLTKKMLGA